MEPDSFPKLAVIVEPIFIIAIIMLLETLKTFKLTSCEVAINQSSWGKAIEFYLSKNDVKEHYSRAGIDFQTWTEYSNEHKFSKGKKQNKEKALCF